MTDDVNNDSLSLEALSHRIDLINAATQFDWSEAEFKHAEEFFGEYYGEEITLPLDEHRSLCVPDADFCSYARIVQGGFEISYCDYTRFASLPDDVLSVLKPWIFSRKKQSTWRTDDFGEVKASYFRHMDGWRAAVRNASGEVVCVGVDWTPNRDHTTSRAVSAVEMAQKIIACDLEAD